MSDFASMFVTPAPGLMVLDPASRQPLPADGAHVPRTTYWLRRLREGDVIEQVPPHMHPALRPEQKAAVKTPSKPK